VVEVEEDVIVIQTTVLQVVAVEVDSIVQPALNLLLMELLIQFK
tara:strand:- start:348 stop:479 length:132 start_codon:yes stop_codon:yes gene_type:complete